jgi:hypothetical protein
MKSSVLATRKLRDPDIRDALRHHLENIHAGEAGVKVIDELGIASHTVRVDLAVLNGSFAGYEIKSDVDTLRRLPVQSRTYDEVFDYMTLVTGRRYLAQARSQVPKHWGIMTAKSTATGVDLSIVRLPRINKKFDKRTLAMMLWRDELIAALKERGAYRGLSRLPKGALWDRLADVTQLDELRDLVRETVKAREAWQAAAQ